MTRAASRIRYALGVVFIIGLLDLTLGVEKDAIPKRMEHEEDVAELVKRLYTEAKEEVEKDEKKMHETLENEPIFHYGFTRQPSAPARRMNERGKVQEALVKKIVRKVGWNMKVLQEHLMSCPEMCSNTPDIVECDEDDPYSRIDGKCNNLDYPLWGAALTPLKRLLDADYSDKISRPRGFKKINGKWKSFLPNPRAVSADIFQTKDDRPSSVFSHMAMIWGQFIAHDTDLSPAQSVHCDPPCRICGECFGMEVPKGDPVFSNKTCLGFKRTIIAPMTGIKHVIPRQQLNEITSYIDASMVYGNDDETVTRVRDGNLGLLKLSPHPGNVALRDFLPPNLPHLQCLSTDKETRPCMFSGDFKRNNENSGLNAIHILFAREHNRIAEKLHVINSHWDDDKLFYEARRIIAAMVQHITYNEYLPPLMGESKMAEFNLNLNKSFTRDYNEDIDASVFNSFSTSAFRFGHSQVGNLLHRSLAGCTAGTDFPMEKFFDPEGVYTDNLGGMDALVRGLVCKPSQVTDKFFATAVHERMLGSDLAAMNINRGRDHALPGYKEFREACNLKVGKKWSTFSDILDNSNIDKLKEHYKKPEDVDLYVGGILEKPVEGGEVGPTFACILGKQFENLRKGDRFWYENGDLHTSFKEQQLAELKKSSLADVICKNSDNIERIQPLALKTVKKGNKRTDCSSIATMDLMKWKDDNIVPVTGGNCQTNNVCVFPFTFQSKKHNECIMSNGQCWCGTTSNFDRDGKWGYCDESEC